MFEIVLNEEKRNEDFHMDHLLNKYMQLQNYVSKKKKKAICSEPAIFSSPFIRWCTFDKEKAQNKIVYPKIQVTYNLALGLL